jgi:hypothetical protein
VIYSKTKQEIPCQANPETADNKVASIATVVRESIVDDQEKENELSTKEKRILLGKFYNQPLEFREHF